MENELTRIKELMSKTCLNEELILRIICVVLYRSYRFAKADDDDDLAKAFYKDLKIANSMLSDHVVLPGLGDM